MSVITAEYAQVLTGEDDIETAVPVSTGVAVSESTLRSTAFPHIAEARGLTWRDTFYDGKDSIVAVFDREWQPVSQFFQSCKLIGWSIAVCFFLATIAAYGEAFDEAWNDFISSIGPLMTFYAGLFIIICGRIQATIEHQHVAVSTEGLRIDNSVSVSVTIPYDQILSCKAYPQKLCYCRDAGFMTISLGRKSSPLEGGLICRSTESKLCLYGIENADGLVRLLMALKESAAASEGSVAALPASSVELMEGDVKQIV